VRSDSGQRDSLVPERGSDSVPEGPMVARFDHRRETELAGFGEPAIGVGHRAELAGETQFPETRERPTGR
jgi:hypothetical protein